MTARATPEAYAKKLTSRATRYTESLPQEDRGSEVALLVRDLDAQIRTNIHIQEEHREQLWLLGRLTTALETALRAMQN